MRLIGDAWRRGDPARAARYRNITARCQTVPAAKARHVRLLGR